MPAGKTTSTVLAPSTPSSRIHGKSAAFLVIFTAKATSQSATSTLQSVARPGAWLRRFSAKSIGITGETFLQPLAFWLTDASPIAAPPSFLTAVSAPRSPHRGELGCDDKTVRILANDFIARLNAECRPQLAEWLGIHETKIAGDMHLVIIDVGNKQVIDMLRDRSKVSVINWLARYRDRSIVRVWQPTYGARIARLRTCCCLTSRSWSTSSTSSGWRTSIRKTRTSSSKARLPSRSSCE